MNAWSFSDPNSVTTYHIQQTPLCFKFSFSLYSLHILYSIVLLTSLIHTPRTTTTAVSLPTLPPGAVCWFRMTPSPIASSKTCKEVAKSLWAVMLELLDLFLWGVLSIGRRDLFHPEGLSGELGSALLKKLGKTSPPALHCFGLVFSGPHSAEIHRAKTR